MPYFPAVSMSQLAEIISGSRLVPSASNAIYAITASYALNSTASGSIESASYANFAESASYALSSSYSVTASYVSGASDSSISSSYSLSSSYSNYVESSSYSLSSSYTDYSITASYANFSLTSSYVESSSYALTASYVSGSSDSSVSSSYSLSSSYADFSLTASYALNGGGGGTSGTPFAGGFATQSFSSEATWSFAHNLNKKYLSIEVYNSLDKVFIPDDIFVVDDNNAEIYFSSPQTGKAIATFGGNITSASYALTASYAENGGGTGGGVEIVNYDTYEDLLSASSSAESGTFGTVSNITNALFFKLGDWFTLRKTNIFQPSASVGYWHLDDNALDYSGNGNHGSASAVSYVTGKVGNAAIFNGTTSIIHLSGSVTDFADAADAPLTFVAWIKPNITAQSDRGILFAQGSTARCYYGIGYTNSEVRMRKVRQGVTDWQCKSPLTDITNWTLIVGIHDPAIPQLRLYVNGGLTNTMAVNTSNGTITVDSGSAIGAGSTSPAGVFSGSIDECIIENRVWTTEEILDYYYQTR